MILEHDGTYDHIRMLVSAAPTVGSDTDHGLVSSNAADVAILHFTDAMFGIMARSMYADLVKSYIKNRLLPIDCEKRIILCIGKVSMSFQIPPDFETNVRWNTQVNNWITEEQFAAEIEESLWEIIPRLRVGTLPTNRPLGSNTPIREHSEQDVTGEWTSRHGEPQ